MKLKTIAIILVFIAVALIVAGFFVPPMGVIDGSVLQGAGEILGCIAILFAWHAVDKGIDAKLTHNNTTIELNNNADND